MVVVKRKSRTLDLHSFVCRGDRDGDCCMAEYSIAGFQHPFHVETVSRLSDGCPGFVRYMVRPREPSFWCERVPFFESLRENLVWSFTY